MGVTNTLRLEERVAPDDDGFASFVRESSTRLLRTAMLLCGDRSEADDLVQTAYTTAFRRWRLVANADNPVAYVRRILTRTYLADRKRHPAHAELVETHDYADSAVDQAGVETRLSLLDALATLPALDRAVLVARYWEDLPVAETAALLGLTEGACRTRASRALAGLRRHFPELED